MTTVFELNHQYQQLQWAAERGELTFDEYEAKLSEITDGIKEKIENIGYLIRNREAAVAGMLEAIESLHKRVESTQKEIERLSALALYVMNAHGEKKIEGRFITVSRAAKPPSVKVIDPTLLPREYLRHVPEKVIPEAWEPDKKLIAADLKEGLIIDGVELVRGERLVIK